jgi:hypothetical protein
VTSSIASSCFAEYGFRGEAAFFIISFHSVSPLSAACAFPFT